MSNHRCSECNEMLQRFKMKGFSHNSYLGISLCDPFLSSEPPESVDFEKCCRRFCCQECLVAYFSKILEEKEIKV